MKHLLRMGGGIGVLALLLSAGSGLLMAQSADSTEITNLLEQAKRHADLAVGDANTLWSYTSSRHAWQSHASRVNLMREHINNLGKIHKDLSDMREQGSLWQKEAIDRIEPLLQEMADNLTNTINHMSENRSHIQFKEYRDYTRANYELAEKTAKTIGNFVEYGKAKSKAASLEEKLELPAAPSTT
ncbi:MAG TPA: hypothetical protein VMV39_06920 [Terracidiphilus sp.]|nr:hypothetical protein [Terracidiphilus sp.]